MNYLKIFTLCFFLLIFSSCTESSSGSGGESTGGGSDESSGIGSFRTSCGTVVGSEIQNPANGEDGIAVRIQRAAGANSVVVSRANGDQIVQLRALSEDVSDIRASRAMSVMDDFRGSAILFTNECAAVVSGGGRGIVGELFSTSGVSLTEAIVEASGASITTATGCSADLMAGCYQSLSDASEPEEGGSVSNFLWKPISERDGNLVVLLSPRGATVIVNGTTLTDFGSSNGRGTTARANRPGAAFGSNVTVQAFDSDGRVLLFPGGADSFNIPNGSERVEF